MRAFGRNASEQLFQRLRDDGLEANALGIDLTALQRKRHATAPSSILDDPEVRRAMDLLVFGAWDWYPECKAATSPHASKQSADTKPCAAQKSTASVQILYMLMMDSFVILRQPGRVRREE